jgi:hypothetical protein
MAGQRLKPCPFCGSDNLAEESTGCAEIAGVCYQSCWIECLNCGAEGPCVEVHDGVPGVDYGAVRDAWNKALREQ